MPPRKAAAKATAKAPAKAAAPAKTPAKATTTKAKQPTKTKAAPAPVAPPSRSPSPDDEDEDEDENETELDPALNPELVATDGDATEGEDEESSAEESSDDESVIVEAPPRVSKTTKNKNTSDAWLEEEAKRRNPHIPLTAEQRRLIGSTTGRGLIPWTRPHMNDKLLLIMHYELARHQIEVPWDQIAHRLHPGSSAGAITQHLTRTRADLAGKGHLVPPPIPKTNGSGFSTDPTVRGYVREDCDDGDVRLAAVKYNQVCADRKVNLPDGFDAAQKLSLFESNRRATKKKRSCSTRSTRSARSAPSSCSSSDAGVYTPTSSVTSRRSAASSSTRASGSSRTRTRTEPPPAAFISDDDDDEDEYEEDEEAIPAPAPKRPRRAAASRSTAASKAAAAAAAATEDSDDDDDEDTHETERTSASRRSQANTRRSQASRTSTTSRAAAATTTRASPTRALSIRTALPSAPSTRTPLPSAPSTRAASTRAAAARANAAAASSAAASASAATTAAGNTGMTTFTASPSFPSNLIATTGEPFSAQFAAAPGNGMHMQAGNGFAASPGVSAFTNLVTHPSGTSPVMSFRQETENYLRQTQFPPDMQTGYANGGFVDAYGQNTANYSAQQGYYDQTQNNAGMMTQQFPQNGQAQMTDSQGMGMHQGQYNQGYVSPYNQMPYGNIQSTSESTDNSTDFSQSTTVYPLPPTNGTMSSGQQ